jgi:hypothetical protein
MYSGNGPGYTRENNPHGRFIQHYLSVVCRHARVIRNTLESFGEESLSVYLKNLPLSAPTPYQQRDDLVEVVYRYAVPLLGESVAQRAAEDLARVPVVLTANHHGVDFFSQSVQGSLLFALLKIQDRTLGTTVPIFSCGNIPLNNLTYPMGMLIYGVSSEQMADMPKKLPVFPNRLKRSVVSVVKGFDESMLSRARERVLKMGRNGEIKPEIAACVERILLSDFLDPEVIRLPLYSQQAVILNQRQWKRLFAKPENVPDLVYIDIEKIVAKLLEADLRNLRSLAWSVIFDPELRDHILGELNGHRVCWQRDHLLQKIDGSTRGTSPHDMNWSGTMFFWGVDSTHRKFSLWLGTVDGPSEILWGVDDKGMLWEIPFTVDSIIEGLRQNILMPSLFTSFLTIALARGMVLWGGYYQAEYLPAIQQGVLRALKKTAGYQLAVETIEQVPTNGYLSGMQTVMTETRKGLLVPAGPLEIIARGGLDADDLERMGALMIRDAHAASLFDTVSDLVGWESGKTDWKTLLAMECHQTLRDRIVVK